MENKLTVGHLAPYLPYGLKAEMLDYQCDYVGNKYDEIVGFHQWDKMCLYWSVLTVGGSKPEIGRIKPILRPLSDISKTSIYWNMLNNMSKNFNEDITVDSDCDIDVDCGGACGRYVSLHDCYKAYTELFKNHFDVFGLIEKGLANRY